MSTPVDGTTPHPTQSTHATPGFVVADRYVLARRIAGGGMGDVWRAHDRTLNRPVAIKLLKNEYLEEPAFLARFRAEARLAGMLNHPGIAAVHDYGEHDGPSNGAWLVMELVEGEPLSRLLHRHGPLPPEQALDLLGQAAIALQAAHDAGVVHRDIKPGNLLVQPDGIIKITDFGIARATGSAPLTQTGTVLGTAHYLSPEQVTGLPASPASDIYALGVVGYECLAGRRPFNGDNPVAVAISHQRDPVPPLPASLPTPVTDLVMRALSKDPGARPTSAGALGRTAHGIRAALYLDEPTPAGGPLALQHDGLAAAVDVPATVLTAGGPAATKALPTTGSPPLGGGSRRRGGWRRGSYPRWVLLGLVVVIAIAALVRGCGSSGSGGGVTVGDVHGKSAASAAAVLRGEGFKVASTTITSSAVARGLVISTSPGAGKTAGRGDTVTMTVSAGPTPIALNLADYRGKPVAQVLAALQALGLKPSSTAVSQAGTPGTVVTIVTPDGGPLPATLTPGQALTVQVVQAPAPQPSAAPPAGGQGEQQQPGKTKDKGPGGGRTKGHD